ncbi:hypothetical protein P154DRAFT_104190 [Amniculicola lignicola CBS 123094]|uniref:Uncharacterized protein n=1 Tax=Amniculicola lignicola CBS 123094 TaxID=1392246 RepID=A0A6A5WQZ4_9PLEO|nr:hypothetical protein P154DRAFT_104190 [Amniculicola lignicola CBS 123094]
MTWHLRVGTCYGKPTPGCTSLEQKVTVKSPTYPQPFNLPQRVRHASPNNFQFRLLQHYHLAASYLDLSTCSVIKFWALDQNAPCTVIWTVLQGGMSTPHFTSQGLVLRTSLTSWTIMQPRLLISPGCRVLTCGCSGSSDNIPTTTRLRQLLCQLCCFPYLHPVPITPDHTTWIRISFLKITPSAGMAGFNFSA